MLTAMVFEGSGGRGIVRRACAALLLGWLAACGDDGGGGPTPRVGEDCPDEGLLRCGIGDIADAQDTIVRCDHGSWVEALACGTGEACENHSERGAVSCSMVNDLVIYGDLNQPCEASGAQACSLDRDFVLHCEGGTWTLQTNCSTEVMRCGYRDEGDEGCTDAAGCVVCL